MKFDTLNQYYEMPDGRKVQRIYALRSFGNVKAGTIGGFVEHEWNLSQEGDCWIADDAIALGWSLVDRNAQLRGRAKIDAFAVATDSAIVEDDAILSGTVVACNQAVVGGHTYAIDGVMFRDRCFVKCRCRYTNSGKTRLPNFRDSAIVRGDASLEGWISMSGNSVVDDHAQLRQTVRMYDNSYAGGYSILGGSTSMRDDTKAIGFANISGRSKLGGRAVVADHSVVRKTILLCNAYVGGFAVVFNEKLSGDMRRTVSRKPS
ncbi:MAG: hypothetical protein FWD31_07465 [Planctomycetaceae bacterium]|nr:hypothetical protein [Planctomycetaceae bacterium]